MGFSAPRENTYVTWLENAASEAEAQADEAEAVADGSWYVGGSTTSYYYSLELVEKTRARARGYREEAQKQRRTSA